MEKKPIDRHKFQSTTEYEPVHISAYKLTAFSEILMKNFQSIRESMRWLEPETRYAYYMGQTPHHMVDSHWP